MTVYSILLCAIAEYFSKLWCDIVWSVQDESKQLLRPVDTIGLNGSDLRPRSTEDQECEYHIKEMLTKSGGSW